MSLQTNYSYQSQGGVPGGIFDSSPRSVISRANGAADPTSVKCGFGIVRGDNPGVNVVLPTEESTPDLFEGVVLSGVAEHDLDGNVRNNPTKVLSIMEWGKVWVRVPAETSVTYGDKAYLINKGEDAGKFTNESENALDIGAVFVTSVDSEDIAAIKLFNSPRVGSGD